MMRIRQRFEATEVHDVVGTVRAELAGQGLESRIAPGETVAISAGSRGIANIATIVRTIAEYLAESFPREVLTQRLGSTPWMDQREGA